jgi:hypothetical protein
MIKTDAHKIENQPKNRHLFETIIPIKQQKSRVMDSIRFTNFL